MTRNEAARLIESNLPAFYGYAFNRLYNADESEDLVSEIVLEILKSSDSLNNDDAFWAFSWRIADNTLKSFIRRREYRSNAIAFDESFITNSINFSTTDDYFSGEVDDSIYLLRREMSMLRSRHRTICNAYYFEGKSCAEIAVAMGISVGMVKQYLMKIRNILRKGMNMERKFGELSYNPKKLYLDFWGDWNHYGSICNRRLPSSILLAAYEKPLAPEEISVELGVAMPYLEEELQILEDAGLLIKVGEKYRTNIVIITDKFDKELNARMSDVYDSAAARIFDIVSERLPEIRSLDFENSDIDDNRLTFTIVTFALFIGYEHSCFHSPLGEPSRLKLGGNGWVFAHDNNYVNHPLKGVTLRNTSEDGCAWFSAINYRISDSAQNFRHVSFAKRVDALLDALAGKSPNPDNETIPSLIDDNIIAVVDGRLAAKFPVFTAAAHVSLHEIIAPAIDVAESCMLDISKAAEEKLLESVPSGVRNQCADIAKIDKRLCTAGYIVESLVKSGRLFVPNEKTTVGIFGVRS